jgi:leucyl-tRNA synthetase
VLANEEVINGRSERGDYPCERRPLKQWMLKITAYAERLLAGLNDLDWPPSVKTMQRDWIGRSEGAEIVFRVADHDADIPVFTTRPDTLFGASFMVLAPEHPLVSRITTVEQKSAVADYVREAASKSELARTDLAKEMTGVWTGAYALNPLFEPGDPRARLPIWIAEYVIVTYGTGAIMAVPAGDQRDFRFAGQFDLPVPPIFAPATGDTELDASVREGRASYAEDAPYINSSNEQGLDLSSMSMVAGKRAVIEWLEKRGAGTAKVTYRLRDWLFSRQRYWGEPFPVLHCEDGSIAPLPDDALPLTLPEMDDFKPSGRPEPPLAKAEEWVNTVGPDGRPARRETNTMPNWAGSCWYYLRFLDPKNDRALVSADAENYWMPVDLYIGGVEHAVLHLLYARFWHMVLYDIGAVSTAEPFQKLYNQGMILSFAYQDSRGAVVSVSEAEADGEGFRKTGTGEPLERIVAKMSKGLHNVVNPDEVIRDYGADALRLYEMYMGPLSDSKPWNPRDVPGVHRFLGRVWRLVVPEDEVGGPVHEHLVTDKADGNPDLERGLHKAIDKVGGDIERLAFNTAIAAMMIFVNDATKKTEQLSRSQALRFVKILSPFAPHIGEELWLRLGGDGLLSTQPWPEVDEKWLREDRVEMAVQVLGKVRGKISVSAEATDAEILELARGAVGSHLEGKKVVKEIVVRGRLVNLVIR